MQSQCVETIPLRNQLESLRILSRQVMAQVALGENLEELRIALEARRDLERDMQKLLLDFRAARGAVHALNDLVPVCYGCKRVRDDRGYWEQIESFIAKSVGVDATSCICPECLQKRFGDARAGGATCLTERLR